MSDLVAKQALNLFPGPPQIWAGYPNFSAQRIIPSRHIRRLVRNRHSPQPLGLECRTLSKGSRSQRTQRFLLEVGAWAPSTAEAWILAPRLKCDHPLLRLTGRL